MVASLRKNILATLTYYDVLEYPLTTFEVWKYYMQYHGNPEENRDPSFDLIRSKLFELRDEGVVSEYQGMWFLSGKRSLIVSRIRKEKISSNKIRRMRKLVEWLRFLPFVRMIAATGSLSYRHGSRKSDWDMFIVMKRQALFTGRFILTFFLHIIGKRRHGKKIIDRACLNYYVTDSSLNVRLQDWYGAHEYQLMVPLFRLLGRDSFYRANAWMTELRPHVSLPLTEHRLTLADTEKSRVLRGFLEEIFFWPRLEKWLAEKQKKKIARNPKSNLPGACIVADDEALVFFPRPRGPRVFEAFQERLRI